MSDISLQNKQSDFQGFKNQLTFFGWFKNIWLAVTTVLKGMAITFKYIYSVKPVTIEYPEVREILPEKSRSRLFNDVDNCISCNQCAVVCPVDCIYITAEKREKDDPEIKTDDGTRIRLNLKQYTIDTALCCYCGLCTTVCPTECLTHTTDYEFSQYAVNGMKYDYLAPDVRQWKDRLKS